jgi:uncharacterized protein YdbL (DUF1318 family)
MPALQLRYALYLCVLLVIAGVLATCYWKGGSDRQAAGDLRVARQTIKVEREALKITHDINLRVNAEGIQIAQSAKAATDEIAQIRAQAPTPTDRSDLAGVVPVDPVGDARILQLAAEARAAALASGARLQPARSGTR